MRLQSLLLALAACAPEPVSVVTLTPDTPAVAAALLEADARWESAGVAPERIQVGPDGAPVRFVPARAPVSETRAFKRGRAFSGVRWIELSSLDVATVTHELGHALGVAEHVDEASCDQPHTMCATAGHAITAADLELACGAGPCLAFAPEG